MSANGSGAAPRTSVLLVDGTGRGHAICDLFTRTDAGVTVYYGPGCDVIEHDRIVPVGSVSLTDPDTALAFLSSHPVDFTVVSNIDALSIGYVDALRAQGHRVIGPTRAAAQLEASKERGKRFCRDHGIPTAAYRSFRDPDEASAYVRTRNGPCVVKTDRLTADGDGSVVCDTAEEALAVLAAFARADGEAFSVVVEERLYGPEISVFALLDRCGYLMFPTAVDFKWATDNDAGKHCDGMGSVAPHPDESPALREEIRSVLLDPLVRGLRADGLDFTGFVYLGAMRTADGLRVMEINARFGDSEAEVVLPGVHSDLTALCRAVLAGEVSRQRLVTDDLVRCSVALTQGCLDPADPAALPGWPFGPFAAGQRVRGLAGPGDADGADDIADGVGDTAGGADGASDVAGGADGAGGTGGAASRLFYGGLRRAADGTPVTCRGRVLHVVGAGRTLAEARRAAYDRVGTVTFAGMRYRSDIGAVAPSRPSGGPPPGAAPARRSTDACETILGTCESTVRSYSRAFPAVFATAKGDWLFTQDGHGYLDFFSGAGALNYGHNPEPTKLRLLAYLQGDGLMHGLDLATSAKVDFLDAFRRHVLDPRGLDYRVQFCSPSGTNAVEAALKLARLVTGRTNVVSFGGAFHGMSSGSLAQSGSYAVKQGLYPSFAATTHVPFPDSPMGGFDSLDLLRRLVEDPCAGPEKPAAVLLETVQAEGGVYVAPPQFLRGLRELCDRHSIVLVVDDIQVGCGRTGTFFSFERAGVRPDLVTLSKSISGYGLPMALLLIKPELDVWQPGQHNGTFRGNQLAFVAATAVIEEFWADDALAADVRAKGELVADYLDQHVTGRFGAVARGAGLIWGIDTTGVPAITAAKLSALCFERGLLVEACGRRGEVLKLLPPLTISREHLRRGLDIVSGVLAEATGTGYQQPRTAVRHDVGR
ncbi:MAG TPA: diaminobutyrate--2-oxoglutarate transaminase [Micromonosporaceae bacterium]|nr:diaminobutyrate--2-oxoglutarate transaminase [Micromonosporaceae bacterium]